MRVCHLVRQYAPGIGGLENFVFMLARSLSDLGVENEIITLDHLFGTPRQTLPKREWVDGLMVRRVPMVGHQRFFLPIIENDALADYDVLHVHGIDGMFDRLARRQRAAGQIHVATSHGLFFHTPWMSSIKTAYLHTITRLAANQYDLLLANSAADESRLRSVSSNVVKLANGVAPLGAFIAHGRDLLCLGRLTRHKYVDRVIRALAEPELTDVRLHVVGPEGDITLLELAALAQSLGVSDRVLLHGGLTRRRLADIASRCGLFVSASNYEGFGMALIEAMSVGLAPVVQANPSFVELLGSANQGQVTDFSNPSLAARAIRHELDHLDDAARAAAIAFAARYSWRGHAAQTLDHYRGSLSRSRSHD